ncbi:MAG: hypothetical protein GWN61_17055 [candidate division Zixibacteria bacterium]|nr:hypothetical protein [candidate division Zixibacteria bacterium]NIS47581.1 hypothetical protein [candidate division Zixibacteria bacterium]NIU15665.1 hypothetical protein [candidate division Zixibacteria bacterium]NIV07830.1 hypothetical protein [candidate division Zixibacteria bacterium]NIX58026.1 hypothetical protein [candidate division Zixibacteria bacterium]
MGKKSKNMAIILLLTGIIMASSVSLSAQDSLVIEKRKSHSPTGALLRSLVIPGWGQLYNDKYIKAGLIAGLESFLIYQTAYYWDKTSTYEDLYTSDTNSVTRLDKFLQYDRYRDLRNQHIWFLGITVVFSIFDAYVDAHLKNFDVDITPDFDENRQDLTLWLNLSLHY